MGLWETVRRRFELASLLLWVPLPFYVYSVAYGSVPIFIPQLYPHSYYNSRYGIEMLPALALFGALAAAVLERRLAGPRPLAARLLQPVVLSLAVVNSLAMIYRVPLILQEAKANSITRVAFERALAQYMESLPPGVPILIQNSDHVGALAMAGIPLRQTLGEGDYESYHPALMDPAGQAAFVIASPGDPVSKAVAEHPDGLKELTILCTTGQPCVRIYQSTRFAGVGGAGVH